ncbi:MAG TPA: acyltransferase family protein [Chthoniobacteraceae bacterium]|nr:acyltransferase family protein [Chthoniobacteraceae bacterium]
MTAVPAANRRVTAIDLTKGALVVCMVIYHSLNYSAERGLAFKYLAFLPPSFIVITGFLLSHIYMAGYTIRDWRLHVRLILRGLRLLALFTLLNVVVQLLVTRGPYGALPGLETFWDYRFETYVSGDGTLAIFEVLLPIAYLLLLAPLLLCLERLHQLVVPAVTLVCLVLLTVWERKGVSWLNPQLMGAGFVGILLGRLTSVQLNRLANFKWLATLAYAGCFTVGIFWGQTFLHQVLSAVLALAAIYGWTMGLRPQESHSARRLELLGRYSLIAYIAQIGILQILARFVGRPAPDSIAFLGLFVGTLLLTMATVETLNWLRSRSAAVSGIYKVVFA